MNLYALKDTLLNSKPINDNNYILRKIRKQEIPIVHSEEFIENTVSKTQLLETRMNKCQRKRKHYPLANC